MLRCKHRLVMPITSDTPIPERTPSPVRLDRMYRRNTRINTVIGNIGSSPFEEQFLHKMKNVSGVDLHEGDIVVSGFSVDPSYPDGYPPNTSIPGYASLISRWLLDESSGNALDIVGVNSLSDNNTVGAGTGLVVTNATYANSRDFETLNSEYFSILDASQVGLDVTGALSIAGYIKIESVVDSGIVTKYNETGNQVAYWTQLLSSGKLRFGVSNGVSSTFVDSSTILSTGTWYHVGFVYNPSNYLRIYINGVLDNSVTTSVISSIQNTSANFLLGAFAGIGGVVAGFFDGLMQDMMVWNTVVSSDDFTTLYDAYTSSVVLPPAQTIRADQITTTTSHGSVNVFGMVRGTILNQKYGNVLVKGYTESLKVDGTTDIAVGDYITTHTVAGIGAKATTGDTVIAKAIEAYSANDSNGVIKAMIIPPRLI